MHEWPRKKLKTLFIIRGICLFKKRNFPGKSLHSLIYNAKS